jgi:hypothetical protein
MAENQRLWAIVTEFVTDVVTFCHNVTRRLNIFAVTNAFVTAAEILICDKP